MLKESDWNPEIQPNFVSLIVLVYLSIYIYNIYICTYVTFSYGVNGSMVIRFVASGLDVQLQSLRAYTRFGVLRLCISAECRSLNHPVIRYESQALNLGFRV